MYHRVTNLQSTWEIVGLRGRSLSSLPSITEIRDITKRSDSNHLKTGICYTKSSKISEPFIFSDLSQYAVVRHKLLLYHNYAAYIISKHTSVIVSLNSNISLLCMDHKLWYTCELPDRFSCAGSEFRSQIINGLYSVAKKYFSWC